MTFLTEQKRTEMYLQYLIIVLFRKIASSWVKIHCSTDSASFDREYSKLCLKSVLSVWSESNVFQIYLDLSRSSYWVNYTRNRCIPNRFNSLLSIILSENFQNICQQSITSIHWMHIKQTTSEVSLISLTF